MSKPQSILPEPKYKVKLFRVITGLVPGYGDDYDSYYEKPEQLIVQTFSEWEEVTFKELRIIQDFVKRNKFEYFLVEYSEQEPSLIPMAIKDQMDFVAKREAKLEKERKDAENKRIANKEKNKQKQLEKAKKLLEKEGLVVKEDR